MSRMAITENEQYPVYELRPVDQDILAEHPEAGLEVDQALIDEYNSASAAWNAVQAKLGGLAEEREARWAEALATESVAGRRDLSCVDPGPCVNGPGPHQWHVSCQEDRS